jgi:PAS domain S-box-containing protein
MKFPLKAKIRMNESSSTSSKLNILSLEDSILDFKMICMQLSDAGIEFDIERVDTEKEFEHALRTNRYDIILADFSLPGFDSFGALQLCTELCPEVPYVCVSGSIGEDIAIELLRLGAVDYVIKDRPERLPFAIKRALNEFQERRTRHNMETALLQSEENYRHSIAESPLGIRIMELNGKTIYANRAFLDIYEFGDLEEFNNTPANIRYTADSFLKHQERKIKRAAGEDLQDYVISIVRKNGEIRHIKVSRREVLWDGTKHFQVINQDITEQKNLTDELIIAKEKAEESDRLKSAFLANMSHEIRTPMNGILGFTELLKEPDLTGENQKLYIEIIEKSGMRLLNIINDIIGISRIESGELELNLTETNINELISLIYNTFKSELEIRNINFETIKSLQDMDAFMKIDREKLNT